MPLKNMIRFIDSKKDEMLVESWHALPSRHILRRNKALPIRMDELLRGWEDVQCIYQYSRWKPRPSSK